MNKPCSKCNLSLDISNYHKKASSKDGYNASCKHCTNEHKIKYYYNNKIMLKNRNKEYYDSNREVITLRMNKYYKRRLKDEPLFNIKHKISSLIRNSVKANTGSKGGQKTTNLLGCSIPDFVLHIQSKFKSDMSWDNYGSIWSYDHICPCAQAQNEEELLKLQHFSNFQPMYTTLNGLKKDKVTEEGLTLCKILLDREWQL